MLIGVPKELKSHEYRVGLVPGSVRELVHHGHKVVVETGAGAGIGFDDRAYETAGAEILMRGADVFAAAEMIVKVKEPQPDEVLALREDQVLFTYLHLAADRKLTEALLRSGAVGIAYETVTDRQGGLPLLAPMSEVAGRMSVQVGAHCLEKEQGGLGILLGGVPGVAAAKVVILGGGVSGINAARMAMGLEAHVTVIDRSLPRLYELDMQFGSQLHTLFSTVENIEREVVSADLLIGAVLVPGAVARTSAVALNNATLPFVLAIADRGWRRALSDDPHLRNGLNTCRGQLTHPAVAHDLGLTLTAPERALAS